MFYALFREWITETVTATAVARDPETARAAVLARVKDPSAGELIVMEASPAGGAEVRL